MSIRSKVYRFHCWMESELNSHYNDVTMSAMAFQITSLMSVYSTVYSGAGQRNHQSSASLAFVRGIHRWPVNSPHKGPVARKKLPFDDVMMLLSVERVTWYRESRWILVQCSLIVLIFYRHLESSTVEAPTVKAPVKYQSDSVISTHDLHENWR